METPTHTPREPLEAKMGFSWTGSPRKQGQIPVREGVHRQDVSTMWLTVWRRAFSKIESKTRTWRANGKEGQATRGASSRPPRWREATILPPRLRSAQTVPRTVCLKGGALEQLHTGSNLPGLRLSGQARLPCTFSLCLFAGQAGFSLALHKALRQKVNLSRVCCSGDSAGREPAGAHPKHVPQLWLKSEMSREDAPGTERSAILDNAFLLPFAGDPTRVTITAFLNWNHPAHSFIL